MPVNGMSVDVEEHFHVQAFSDVIHRDSWQDHPRRAADNTARILDIFAQHSVQATFFVLGWLAEREPGMVKAIVAAGHELASHGFDHTPAFHQSPAEFRADISRTKAVLEDLGGVPVTGYRAPSFSVRKENEWVFGELSEAGYAYSSSIFPVRHDFYGWPEAPRFTFRPADSDFLECPLTTVELGGSRYPCGGGGYFRIFPYSLFTWALRRVTERESRQAFFYLHPWEIDPDQPRVRGARLKSRLRHYLSLRRVEGRLHRLLDEFNWGRYDEILGLRAATS